MEAEMSYLLEEQARKLENAEMLIERLKREVMALSFSVELHDRAAEKARALWAETHPDEAEEWLRREDLMVWLMDRVERAEAVKESLTSALENFIEAYYRGLIGAVPDMPPAFIFLDNPPPSPIVIRNLLEEMVREAESVLRTAEDSSVVDSTPAKQFQNAENADEDGVVVIDIAATLHAKTEAMKRMLVSQPISPELAALGRELVRLAEKSLGEVEE